MVVDHSSLFINFVGAVVENRFVLYLFLIPLFLIFGTLMDDVRH